ncbi:MULTISPECIES: hypothetical protein [unclassified Ruminococcus]|uniref:hypothetical protein n=1 Tax=unclassified Ruminococcus TaxID=2608920 RepID=UPI0009311FF0|nr:MULTISPECIES: hypothetical protein [unclassified Ruminococcus]
MANIITGISIALLIFPAFSMEFYALYIAVGILHVFVQIRGIKGVTLSKQCKAFSQFLWERIAVLAEVDFYSERLVCIQAALFRFFSCFLFGDTGVEPSGKLCIGAFKFEIL